MTMGNIECILATVNNLSDSDLKILANLIMDRLNPEKAFASPVKIVPRMECPVCHTSAHVVSQVPEPLQPGIPCCVSDEDVRG